MFIIGYFNVPFTDALGYGYGDYAFDISGMFVQNTSVISGSINWSFFLPTTTILSIESFSYLGLGGIFLLIFIIIIFIFDIKIFIKKKKFLPFFFDDINFFEYCYNK